MIEFRVQRVGRALDFAGRATKSPVDGRQRQAVALKFILF